MNNTFIGRMIVSEDEYFCLKSIETAARAIQQVRYVPAQICVLEYEDLAKALRDFDKIKSK